MGELLAKNYNFQNLDEINRIFSKILNINFYEKLKELIKTREYKKNINFLRLDVNFYPIINEVIEHRHKLIHNISLYNNENIKFEKLKKYSHQIQSLALTTGWLLDEVLGLNLKEL